MILLIIFVFTFVFYQAYSISQYDYIIKHSGTSTVAVDTNGTIVKQDNDSSVVINYVIQTLNTKGSGTAFVKNDSPYQCKSVIYLLSNVDLYGDNTKLINYNVLQWFIVSPNNQILYKTKMIGFDIDGKNNSHAIDIYSVQRSKFDVTIRNSYSALVIDTQNKTTPIETILQQNSAFSEYNLKIDNATIGIGLTGTLNYFTTDNKFDTIIMTNISGWGIDFSQWCDSNYFGYTFIETSKNSTVGVMFNPWGNVVNGVYDEHFDDLVIDNWGSGAIGVDMKYTYHNTIDHLYGSIWGGTTGNILFKDEYATSYIVNDMVNLKHYEKGIMDIKL